MNADQATIDRLTEALKQLQGGYCDDFRIEAALDTEKQVKVIYSCYTTATARIEGDSIEEVLSKYKAFDPTAARLAKVKELRDKAAAIEDAIAQEAKARKASEVPL